MWVALPARRQTERRGSASAFRGLAGFSASLKANSLIGVYCAPVFSSSSARDTESEELRVRGPGEGPRCSHQPSNYWKKDASSV